MLNLIMGITLRPFSEQLVHQHPLSRLGLADLATTKNRRKKQEKVNTMIVRSERVRSDFLALM